jgi:hypothetical protein
VFVTYGLHPARDSGRADDIQRSIGGGIIDPRASYVRHRPFVKPLRRLRMQQFLDKQFPNTLLKK